jgi:hypothetical protein
MDDMKLSLNTLDREFGCLPSTSLPKGVVLLPFPLSRKGEGGATAPGEVVGETRVREQAVEMIFSTAC